MFLTKKYVSGLAIIEHFIFMAHPNVHGWVQGMQVLPRPFCLVVREDSCIHRLGRSAMLHDPGISQVLKQNLITLPQNIAKSEGKVERKMQRNQLV